MSEMKNTLLMSMLVASAISMVAGPTMIVASHGGEFSSCAVNECDRESDQQSHDIAEFVAVLEVVEVPVCDGCVWHPVGEPVLPPPGAFQLAHANRGPPVA